MADIILDRQRDYPAKANLYPVAFICCKQYRRKKNISYHLRFLFCSISPPRTNICIEYSSTSVTSVLTFRDLVRKWHHNSDEKVRVPSVSDSFAAKHFNDAQVLFSNILASPFFGQKFCNKSMMHDCQESAEI